MASFPIVKLDDNPFNSRSAYDEKDIQKLSDSISKNGLVSPIVVRENGERFQIVCGHRRVRAARLLGWHTIHGRVENYSDEEMLRLSLIENLHRKDISDYELALCMRRLSVEFRKTYEQIGEFFGYSKSHVCNILAMLNLIDEQSISAHPQLKACLSRVSEHHARILFTISEPSMRARMLELTASEQLSVRELQRILSTLRGWFRGSQIPRVDRRTNSEINASNDADDLASISELLQAPFVLPRKGDFQKYLSMHEFNQLSVYDDFAPYVRLENKQVLIDHMKVWFNAIAPNISMKVRNVQVKRFGKVALATAEVEYRGKAGNYPLNMTSRGTVVFCRTASRWKIVHKHWSRLDQNCPIDMFAPKMETGESLPGHTMMNKTTGILAQKSPRQDKQRTLIAKMSVVQ